MRRKPKHPPPKAAVLTLIRRHGASEAIATLAEALRDLGPDWYTAAARIGSAVRDLPATADDGRAKARCGECEECHRGAECEAWYTRHGLLRVPAL